MRGLILFVTAVIIDLTVRWHRTEPQLGRRLPKCHRPIYRLKFTAKESPVNGTFTSVALLLSGS